MWEKSRPPEPVPDNVRLTFSKSIQESYWANVCEHCGAIQGDWFLFSEPDGPFFGEPLEQDWVDNLIDRL
jgi:hypothetical protein